MSSMLIQIWHQNRYWMFYKVFFCPEIYVILCEYKKWPSFCLFSNYSRPFLTGVICFAYEMLWQKASGFCGRCSRLKITGAIFVVFFLS